MSNVTTVLLITNLVISASTPIMNGIYYMMSHLKSSKCCNSELDFKSDDNKKKDVNNEEIKIDNIQLIRPNNI